MVSKKMIRNWAMALVASGMALFLALPPGAEARVRTSGAKVIIVAGQASEWIRGELIGVRSDAVVIGTAGGETRTIAIKDISSVRILRRSAAVPGILIGGVAGGLVGAASAHHELKKDPCMWIFLPQIFLPLSGAIVGGASGALVGALLGKDTTYDLTKKSPAEVEKFMGKLRKMARVPNYQ
jgi:hypothetical protein